MHVVASKSLLEPISRKRREIVLRNTWYGTCRVPSTCWRADYAGLSIDSLWNVSPHRRNHPNTVHVYRQSFPPTVSNRDFDAITYAPGKRKCVCNRVKVLQHSVRRIEMIQRTLPQEAGQSKSIENRYSAFASILRRTDATEVGSYGPQQRQRRRGFQLRASDRVGAKVVFL